MDYTSGPGNQSGQFFDGDPISGVPATTVEQVWLNNVQNELVGLEEDAGLTPSAANETQVREAIARWVGRNNILFNSNLVEQNTRLSAAVPVAAGETKIIADGWEITATGLSIVDAQSGGGSAFAISGSGTVGQSFTLKPKLSAANYLNKIELFAGEVPTPENIFTMALRAGTRVADSSASATVDIIENDSISDVVDVTDIDSTQGVLDGGIVSDSYSLATYKYKLAQQVGEAATLENDVPFIKFTLTSSGGFKFYLNGCGLWNAQISDAFIPSSILPNALVDKALASTFERPVFIASLSGISWASTTNGYKGTVTINLPYDYNTTNAFAPYQASIVGEDTSFRTTIFSVKSVTFADNGGKLQVIHLYIDKIDEPSSPSLIGNPYLYLKPLEKF